MIFFRSITSATMVASPRLEQIGARSPQVPNVPTTFSKTIADFNPRNPPETPGIATNVPSSYRWLSCHSLRRCNHQGLPGGWWKNQWKHPEKLMQNDKINGILPTCGFNHFNHGFWMLTFSQVLVWLIITFFNMFHQWGLMANQSVMIFSWWNLLNDGESPLSKDVESFWSTIMRTYYIYIYILCIYIY